MMRPGAKIKKVYRYPKPVDFRKSIDGLSALVELDIKAAVFDPVNWGQMKITYEQHRAGKTS